MVSALQINTSKLKSTYVF